MKKLLWSSIMMVMILSACQSEPESIEDLEVPEESEGFFWEGEHNDKEVYILGTIHAGEEDMYPLRDEIEDAISDAEYLMTEIDMSDQSALMEMAEKQREYMYLEGGERLDDYLNEEQIDQVREVAQSNMLTFDMVNSFQPWMVEELFAQHILTESEYSYDHGVEEYLYDNVSDDTEIGELESYDDLIDQLYTRDMDSQLYTLEQNLSRSVDEQIEDLSDMLKAWRAGEEDFIGVSREVEEDAENPEIEEDYVNRLLFERDQGMADSIEDTIENHDASKILIAAGTAHFFGEDNVLELLEERGYDFERK
ncbi:TraB/GumN family protein [Halalkalibacillus halophilus]|uniref:TraB/GumN family protein n=1 Tax=Halalkalibacillus halophilus TaxID=392827 RepID=UPI0003FCD8E7|nr:TraB/GumN family protein [Halalkalibacillus halophilus]